MARLLQINCSANTGSTGKIAEEIGKIAIKSGWESYIAYGRTCSSSQSNLIKIGNSISPYLHYAEQRIFDNEGLCSRKPTKRLIKQIEIIKPDIIQLHNIHDHYLNYKLLFEYLNSTNIKVVWTFHDCWAMTGHCFHFVTANCERWKKGCYNCPLRCTYPHTLLDRSDKNWFLKKSLLGGNKNMTIVACSQWISDFVRESFLSSNNIVVFHNGVDLKKFNIQTKVENNSNRVFKILAVSNIWYAQKGELDVYKLRELLPESEFEITMVGLSAKQMKRIPKGIVGIQRTRNVSELLHLYSASDVLINPTYHDTFPTVNLEALACGTPVITYNTGGSPEAIDEKTGVVIKQGDVAALANEIFNMRNNPLSALDCRKRAERLFDKDKCYRNYIDLYNELIK